MAGFDINFLSKKDGCTYCWDETNGKWLKVCSVDEVPDDVKQQVLEKRKKLEEVKI